MKTKRLYFRERTKELMERVFDMSLDEQGLFLGLKDEDRIKMEMEVAQKRMSNYRTEYKMWDFIELGTEVVIGNGGFHSWFVRHERAEVGYRINKPFRKQGFMSEAFEGILQYGFEEMKLNRIEALISPDNIPSIKLVEKYAFQKEGLLREHYNHKGVLHDSVIYALLKSEYLALK